MEKMKIIIVGGGASGVFAALQCRTVTSAVSITILEKSDKLLAKVLLSGGGRCNVSHTAPDIKSFLSNYPRGHRFLWNSISRFGPDDTRMWFENRGVSLKTEPDGRVFPVSNCSQTVVDCLTEALHRSGVAIRFGSNVRSIHRSEPAPGYTCVLDDESEMVCDRLCIATGGNRGGRDSSIVAALGHTVVEPVPSLFPFVIPDPRLSGIPGVAVDDVVVSIPQKRFSARGSLLVTHRGVSGPAVLRLSSLAARHLHDHDYRSGVSVNWCPGYEHGKLLDLLNTRRSLAARTGIDTGSPVTMPLRLWQSLVIAAGCTAGQRWSDLSRQQAHDLAGMLHRSLFSITGMDTSRSEMVTCGGVDLGEVDARTMQSRLCKGLYFCGEALDIDGVTGGFNLQAAWTTGWVAGTEVAS